MLGRPSDRVGFPGGLRAQLLLGLLIVVLAAVGLIASLALQIVSRTVEASERQLTTAAAQRLAQALRPPSRDIAAVAADFARAESLTFAGLRRPGGLVGHGPSASLEADAAKLQPGGAPMVVQIAGHPHLLAAAPAPQGHAVVARSFEAGALQISRTRDLLLVYLGIDALFVLIIGYGLLTWVILRPVRAIGVATERAANGDLASPITALPANELGRVGHSFNHMLAHLRAGREQREAQLDELRRAHQELHAAQESLIRSEKLASVGQLAAGVAHEIGNPLAAVAGYVELLEDETIDAQTRREMLTRASGQLDRIQLIIRDLLDFSRVERDQTIADMALRPSLSEALDLVKAQPKARDVDLHATLPHPDIRVRAVAGQLVQVLVNLMLNAVDAAGSGGTVTVGSAHHDDRVVVAIRDDGDGIASDDLPRIFDPFFTTKPPGAGTGLGLPISARIIERFGGTITVTSEVGHGACFEITLLRESTHEADPSR